MQKRIENATSIVRRKQGTGFDGDHDEPEDRGDPRLQKVLPFGFQAYLLLDAIIGSLAGNHDVMNVALAQSGATDAHEASFLQQFGNGSAPAVAHA
jgi:hypothetical protein